MNTWYPRSTNHGWRWNSARNERYNLSIEQCRLALQESPSDQSAMYHLIIALRHSGPEAQGEIQALVKQLSELKKTSREQETERKRFQLVKQQAPSPH